MIWSVMKMMQEKINNFVHECTYQACLHSNITLSPWWPQLWVNGGYSLQLQNKPATWINFTFISIPVKTLHNHWDHRWNLCELPWYYHCRAYRSVIKVIYLAARKLYTYMLVSDISCWWFGVLFKYLSMWYWGQKTFAGHHSRYVRFVGGSCL